MANSGWQGIPPEELGPHDMLPRWRTDTMVNPNASVNTLAILEVEETTTGILVFAR